MDNYHLELLQNMKNENNKYLFFLQDQEIIDEKITIDNDNILEKELLEKELEKDLNIIYNKLKLFKEKSIFSLPLPIFKFYNKIVNDLIINNCHHEFIEDDIDISPGKTKRIYYCSKCENNLDDCQKK